MKLVLAALVVLGSLAACDTGPRCVRHHYEERMVYGAHQPMLNPGAIPMGGGWHLASVYVCDEYAR